MDLEPGNQGSPHSSNPHYSHQPSRGWTPPQVVHVVSKPTTFGRVFGIIGGFLFIGLIFIVGIVIGVVATTIPQPKIMPDVYRSGNFNKIAIIPVKGLIMDQQSDFVRHCVDHVLNDPSYGAVVLRVNSPGGGITASDQIWYQIHRLREKNVPVVASYGALAASGGYYASCHADHIVAEETSVTGSIGVIAQVFTVEELANKVGIEPVTLVATGSPDKDVANNIFRSWNERDKEKVRQMLDAAYDVFCDRVAQGRSGVLPESASLDRIADGSVFTANEALERGLIDQIGYLDDAITKAEKMAALRQGQPTVHLLKRPPTFFPPQSMLKAQSADVTTAMLDADRVRNLVNELSSPRVMYLMR